MWPPSKACQATPSWMRRRRIDCYLSTQTRSHDKEKEKENGWREKSMEIL